MPVMFWVWLGIILLSLIIEIATVEMISIWFTFGAIVPFILSATTELHIVWQIVIFCAVSAVLMASLRSVTKRFFLRNCNTKTNTDMLIGKKVTMLERTDFEHLGKVKINDVEWSAVGDNAQTIEQGVVVEIVGLAGNKLVVKSTEQN